MFYSLALAFGVIELFEWLHYLHTKIKSSKLLTGQTHILFSQYK